jgi:hypothetical protein
VEELGLKENAKRDFSAKEHEGGRVLNQIGKKGGG